MGFHGSSVVKNLPANRTVTIIKAQCISFSHLFRKHSFKNYNRTKRKEKTRKGHSGFLLVARHGEAKEGYLPGWSLVSHHQLIVGHGAISSWLRNKGGLSTGKGTKVPTYKETKKVE